MPDEKPSPAPACKPAPGRVLQMEDHPDGHGMLELRSFAERRGLSLAQAEAMGWRYYSQNDLALLLGAKQFSDGIGIHYFDENGAPVVTRRHKREYPFVRVRLLRVEGAGKYRQRAGTDGHARLTPGIGIDWASIGASPSPLLITEGEIKADTVNTALRGGGGWPPCVGLPGVTAWNGRKQRRGLLPEVDGWQWPGRDVYLAFDYDASVPRAARYKPQVAEALERLAAALTARGASVFAVHLADTGLCAEGTKLGVDDYLRAGGTWEALLSTAQRAGGESPLEELLAEYATLRRDERVLDLRIGTTVSRAAFDLHTANKFAEGEDGKRRRASALWLASPRRIAVDAITSLPHLPHGLVYTTLSALRETIDAVVDDLLPGSAEDVVLFNTFRAPEGWGDLPREGDAAHKVIAQWKRLVRVMLGGEQEVKIGELETRFHQWVAQVVQHPERKNVAIWTITHPKQGIGKSLVAETVASLFGGMNTSLLGPGSFDPQWTKWYAGKLLVVVDEIGHGTGKFHHSVEEFLKHIATSPVLEVREKYRAAWTALNTVNVIMTTNHPLAYRTTSGARRDMLVSPGAEVYDGSWREFVNQLARTLRGAERDECRNLLRRWYRGIDLSGYDPNADAIATDTQEEAEQAGMSSAEDAAALAVEQLRVLRRAVLARVNLPWDGILISNDQLRQLAAACSEDGASFLTVKKHLLSAKGEISNAGVWKEGNRAVRFSWIAPSGTRAFKHLAARDQQRHRAGRTQEIIAEELMRILSPV